jgi:zinc protease
MINRNEAPQINELKAIEFVQPKTFDITPSVFLHWLNEVADETVRLELHFDAGTIRGEEKLAAIANSLLLSGTKDKKSIQIHEELNRLGAYIDQEIGHEIAVVSLFCLREHFSKAFEILADAIEHVIFDETELSDTIREKKQHYLISSEKVNVLARRAFQTNMFENTPKYGRYMNLEDYDAITSQNLRHFHREFYMAGLTEVIVVANLEIDQIDRIIDRVGGWSKEDEKQFESEIMNKVGHIHLEKEGALQTAIRMGIPLFNKHHEDFIDFTVLQTIFGDYFGSRLMSNIREDKGYTYGIGCGLSELRKTGYFLIATEVATEVCDATIKEIRFEMERLHTELVSEEELQLVKNYMLGQLLKSADGPNAMMDLFMSVQLQGMDYSFYNLAIEKIKQIDSNRIQQLAKKYLIWENFTLITAG